MASFILRFYRISVTPSANTRKSQAHRVGGWVQHVSAYLFVEQPILPVGEQPVIARLGALQSYPSVGTGGQTHQSPFAQSHAPDRGSRFDQVKPARVSRLLPCPAMPHFLERL